LTNFIYYTIKAADHDLPLKEKSKAAPDHPQGTGRDKPAFPITNGFGPPAETLVLIIPATGMLKPAFLRR
jgi:hypothetical protein